MPYPTAIARRAYRIAENNNAAIDNFLEFGRRFGALVGRHVGFATDVDDVVACRSEFVTADAAGGVGVFPLNGSSVGGVGVDVAAEFAS